MDAIIIRIARIEARAAARLRAFGGWWFERAVGRGLRALARGGHLSDLKSQERE